MNRDEMNRGVVRKRKKYYDYTLLFLIVFLVCFGLVMISSISAYNATKYYSDSMLFVKRQALFALVGFAAMIFISKAINYHWLFAEKQVGGFRISIASVAMIVCLALQILVLLVGAATNGATRWFEIGPVKIQPSEMSKIALILYATMAVNRQPRVCNTLGGFFGIAARALPLIALVAAENMSTAIIMACIICGVCLIASRRRKHYFVVFLIGVVAVVIGIVGTGFRTSRIESWLNVDTADGAYQIRQGLYAIASGGWFGKGLGNSIQKLGYIPEVHTDMIFTCICEELGIFGAICVIALFALLLWRIFAIAVNAPDLMGGLLVCGVMIQIAVQVIMNIAVVTNTMPSTGIPLPFISYGGSSLVFMLAELGLVLNVANQIDYQKK